MSKSKKQKLAERIKLAFARIIDKLYPDVCWCDLVLWAMDCHTWDEIHWNGQCRREPYFLASWGGCYCGKHMTTEMKMMLKGAK